MCVLDANCGAHHNPRARIAVPTPETSGHACANSQLKHPDAANVSESPAPRFAQAIPCQAAAASMPRGACSLARGMPGAFLVAELHCCSQSEAVTPLQRLLVLGRGVRTPFEWKRWMTYFTCGYANRRANGDLLATEVAVAHVTRATAQHVRKVPLQRACQQRFRSFRQVDFRKFVATGRTIRTLATVTLWLCFSTKSAA